VAGLLDSLRRSRYVRKKSEKASKSGDLSNGAVRVDRRRVVSREISNGCGGAGSRKPRGSLTYCRHFAV